MKHDEAIGQIYGLVNGSKLPSANIRLAKKWSNQEPVKIIPRTMLTCGRLPVLITQKGHLI
jgi:hypothetical protein